MNILVVEDDRDIREMVGQSLAHNDFRTVGCRDVQEAKKSIARLNPDCLVIDCMLPDGSGVDLIRWVRRQDEYQQIPVLMLTARNVSDQKQLQESLKDFVANASHELKSPLTVISGHLEMLDAKQGLGETGKVSLAIARRQAAGMKDLIQSLLLLSQVESYQLKPNEGERIAVHDLMTSAMAAIDKNPDSARVEWDYSPDLYLLGIKAEIEGICINLIDNALKYSTPATPIRVSWERNLLGELTLSVSNEGPGIDPHDLPRLTERYFRAARSSADIAGSGLGLAIVQQAANKHGALLEFDSQPGASKA